MFYPPIEPFRSFYFPVSKIHTLYVEEVGNPQGIPIVFLHGGPGSGLDVQHRQFFDPEKFRVILFDQRGSGKSLPYAECQENTTELLVDDIEKIRAHLNISSWHVFGGSWGSFLALAYAEAHPSRVKSLILRGLFLGRQEEIEFFYQKGASFIYPEMFEAFISILCPEEQKHTIQSYYKRLFSQNPDIVLEAARHWAMWEASCLRLVNTEQSAQGFATEQRFLSLAKIEAHYFYHDCFIRKNQLLNDAGRLKNIPVDLVHGRYDLICPIENAFLLKKQLPQLELHISTKAGHAATEPETLKTLHEILQKL